MNNYHPPLEEFGEFGKMSNNPNNYTTQQMFQLLAEAVTCFNNGECTDHLWRIDNWQDMLFDFCWDQIEKLNN